MTNNEERQFGLDYYFKTMKYGTYIAATPTEESLDSLEKLQKRLGIKNPVSRDEMHCTIIYSLRGDPNVRPYNKGWTAEASGLRLLGENKNCLVLELESEDLQRRHEQLKYNGLTHTFDEYIPHITLSYEYEDEEIDDELLYDENGDSVVLVEFESEYSEPLER